MCLTPSVTFKTLVSILMSILSMSICSWMMSSKALLDPENDSAVPLCLVFGVAPDGETTMDLLNLPQRLWVLP